MHRKANVSQFSRQRFGIPVRHIDDQKVLHDSCPQIARGKALREFRSSLQLLRTDASAQNPSPYKAEPFLFLRMNPDVVPIDIVRRKLWLGGIELKAEHALQFTLESFPSPAFPKKEELQARSLAMLTQAARAAKELGNSANHVDDLIPADESIQPNAKMRIRRQPTTHAQGKASLGLSPKSARDRRQPNVVDLRIRAPGAATGERNFKLSRQVIELGVAGKQVRCLKRQWRRIADLVRIEAGDRAASNIPDHVTASPQSREAVPLECFKHFRQRFGRHPVQLNILPHSNVSDAASETP